VTTFSVCIGGASVVVLVVAFMLWYLGRVQPATVGWVGNERQVFFAQARRGLRVLGRSLRHAAGLVYPPTKAKLHRVLHLAGVLVAGALGVAVWLVTSKLGVTEKITADLGVLVVLLTRWRAAIASVDAAVDKLPIPDDDRPTPKLAVVPKSEDVTKPEKAR